MCEFIPTSVERSKTAHINRRMEMRSVERTRNVCLGGVAAFPGLATS